MKPRQRGFTLIELAIVMLVLTILAAGVLVPLTSSIQMKRYEATQQLLEEAKQALIGFAMSHKPASGRPYLPCPDTNNDGIEDRPAGHCENQEGNFPWATLGVGNADAWGNRLRYRVTTDPSGASPDDFADSSKGFNNTPKIKLADQLRVCTPPTCTQIVDDGGGVEGVPVISAIIVSHGPNGWGALNANGTAQAPPPLNNPDELENTNSDTKFISRAPTQEFDDLLIALPTAVLVSRACLSGCP
jgi:prepilin-type N-terminal cleavage/methylation domain-containing protein